MVFVRYRIELESISINSTNENQIVCHILA